MDEQDYRRHLDEVHRQLLERDNAFRFSEEQIAGLRGQLTETQGWALELEARMREMEATRAWRFALRLRSLRASARRLVRLGR